MPIVEMLRNWFERYSWYRIREIVERIYADGSDEEGLTTEALMLVAERMALPRIRADLKKALQSEGYELRFESDGGIRSIRNPLGSTTVGSLDSWLEEFGGQHYHLRGLRDKIDLYLNSKRSLAAIQRKIEEASAAATA